MNEKSEIRVDAEAAIALVRWKSLFADDVAAGAIRLALAAGEHERVTLAHYTRAAQSALRSLSAVILDGEQAGDEQEAA